MKYLIAAAMLYLCIPQAAFSGDFSLPQIKKSECKNMTNPITAYKFIQKYKNEFDAFGNTPINKVAPTTLFKAYSGNADPTFNHPAIYAHGKKEPKVTVVGCGTYKEFPLAQLEVALAEYRNLLKLNGYEEK